MPQANRFTAMVAKLKKFYGRPTLPVITDPFELILWENVGYLVDDEKRAAAFAALKKKIGTKPEQLLKASQEQLEAITRMGGMAPEVRAQRLRQIAETAQIIFKGNLAAELSRPLPQAKKSLQRFPSIGEPGAEKILMITRSHPVLSLESNGLRVLLRVGYAEEQKSYSSSYRLVQQALVGQLPTNYDDLIAAHQLLRQHGQELCKRTRPLCDAGCPLTAECRYFQTSAT